MGPMRSVGADASAGVTVWEGHRAPPEVRRHEHGLTRSESVPMDGRRDGGVPSRENCAGSSISSWSLRSVSAGRWGCLLAPPGSGAVGREGEMVAERGLSRLRSSTNQYG